MTKRTAVWLTVLAAICWGSNAISAGAASAPAGLTVTARAGVSVLVLFGWVYSRGQLSWPQSWQAWAAVVTCTASNVLFALSARGTDALSATALTFTFPVVAILLEGIVHRQLPGWRSSAVIALSLLGITVFFGGLKELRHGQAELMALAAGLNFGVHVYFAGRMPKAKEPQTMPNVMLFSQVLGTAVGIAATVWRGESLSLSAHQAGWLVILGLGSAAGYTLWALVANQLKPHESGPILTLEPVVAGVLGWIISNQVPTPHALLGSTIIVLAFTLRAALSRWENKDSEG